MEQILLMKRAWFEFLSVFADRTKPQIETKPRSIRNNDLIDKFKLKLLTSIVGNDIQYARTQLEVSKLKQHKFDSDVDGKNVEQIYNKEV